MSRRDSDLESLLERAAPRPEPPAEVRDRVLAAVEQEWRQHKRRRWGMPLALAAALLVAVAGALLVTDPTDGARLRVHESAGLWVDGVLHRQSGIELTVERGTTLESDGGARLATAEDIEVRLRGGSRVRWLEADAVALEAGSIYIDTHERGHLRVQTPLGVVTDVGTTFMVTLEGGAMEVAVRAGAAAIDTEHGRYTARAGDRQGDVVTVDRQRISARREPASAGRWQWIHAVHPGYSHREVLPLLQDIARDLGLTLEFASPAVQAAALEGRLEGDISGLGPEQALEVVLATTGFTRRDGPEEKLVIEFLSPDE
jgi:ferric-dicitrate binding protein FerR (iron transport regulator)